MPCGCFPRLFRKRTCPLGSVEELPEPESSRKTSLADAASEVATTSVGDENGVPPEDDGDTPKSGSAESEEIPNLDKKSLTARWTAPLLLRSFFKGPNPTEETSVRCEFSVQEDLGVVHLTLRCEEGTDTPAAHRSLRSGPIPSLFRRGRKTKDDEMGDLIRAQQPSVTSTKSAPEDDAQGQGSRGNPRSVFCFGWGQTDVIDDEDEAITQCEIGTEAPPGLVGLMNLGNTCFLNAALQCLRCTPGFASLVVPELSQGFEGVGDKTLLRTASEKDVPQLPQLRHRSHSFTFRSAHVPSHLEWDCHIAVRSSSLPYPLPYEIAARLEGETGLAGGSVSRLSSVPNLKSSSAPQQSNNTSHSGDENAHVKRPKQECKENEAPLEISPVDARDHQVQSRNESTVPSSSSAKCSSGPTSQKGEEEITDNKTAEIELSADFISAFQKLVMEVCLGDAEHHRSPKDLYLQLQKLPQGEWFCDGGQHDCQEILKVLLDAIHANYAVQRGEEEDQGKERFGRCISDVSEETMMSLKEIELETMKANSLWRHYLSRDASPITQVFAGQLQTVRSCQKCHCRSTTYEPFWDLSLSLSREKPSWFNPGRMPSSLDDLMRAFTSAEVLQGDESPYCDCCEQKSPATRRILIHRFPKVLVINIKRFKYTKDGREKLTSNISFPIRSLRLQNFTSKEHQVEGASEVYDLYAVSNHYGTLGGGHYTAFCKVKDTDGKDGWYSFNDKAVVKISDEAVVTPNAYILFYAMRPELPQGA